MTDSNKNMRETGWILPPQFKTDLEEARGAAKEAYKKALSSIPLSTSNTSSKK